MPPTVLVTGTGTGVGKTVLASLLVRHLRDLGRDVRGFKPLCSGGRDDARSLWRAQGRAVPVDVINPWWFPEPVTPLLAARRAGVRLRLADVQSHLATHAPTDGLMVVEGAGGLLSPLGEDFDSRDLLRALDALPWVVAVNRLGVLNECRLTHEALPSRTRKITRWILFDPPEPDASSTDNLQLLAELLGTDRIHPLPRLVPGALRRPPARVTALVDGLVRHLDADLQAWARGRRGR